MAGIWTYNTALGWYVWELTGSAEWLKDVTLCYTATVVGLAPFAGAAADRFGARRTVRTSQFWGAGVMAAMALLAALDAMTIELLVVLVVLNGVAMALFLLSYFSLVAHLVPREDLCPAIVLQFLILPIASGLGPALAGRLIPWQGVAAGFAGTAATYLTMAAIMLAISYRDPEGAAERPGYLAGDVAPGLRYMAGQPTIRTLLLIVVAFSILMLRVVTLPPALVADPFGRGAEGRQLLLAAVGGGALAGVLWLAWRGRTRGLTRLFGATGIALGIALAGFAAANAATDTFGLGVALMAVCGLSACANWLIGTILVLNCTDPAMRGRAWGLIALALHALPAASAAALTWLAARFGAASIIAVAACTAVLIGLWTLGLIRTARLDERAEGPPAG